MTTDGPSAYLASLVRELCALPRETEWVEFKENDAALVDTQRFVDTPPRSRNEALASLMRRFRICEERGSGIDGVAAARGGRRGRPHCDRGPGGRYAEPVLPAVLGGPARRRGGCLMALLPTAFPEYAI